jgi:predicted O-methyltransferase YrrM
MSNSSSVADVDRGWDAYNEFHFQCDQRRFQKLFARLDLFRMVADLPGDIVDAGAFKGVSTIQFAQMLAAYQPNTRSRVVCFDTFEAHMQDLRPDEAAAGDRLMANYRADSYEHLLQVLDRLELRERVDVVRGDIATTLPAYLAERRGFRISLLHCDLDAYAPTLATLRAAWPRVVPSGLVVFDEYAIDQWGESDAVDEFFREAAPHVQLKLLGTGRTPSAYVRKPSF